MAADWERCRLVTSSFVICLASLPLLVAARSYQCPASCTCLGSLVDCSKRDLTAVPDDLPTWVEILDLSSNKLASIGSLSLQGLTNLEKLDLSNNELDTLNATTVSSLPVLRELKLNYNHLRDLPVLGQMMNITFLAVQHNDIESISTEALDSLPKLRTLDLGYNQIKQLSNDMFPLHANLHQLYLNNNRIKRIDMGALKNVPNLQWLKLNKNKIRHLPKEVFVNLTKLQDLELSRNRLQMIEGLTFKGLTSLVTLKLDRNAISDLMDGAFYGPGNIHNLILNHNNITSISKGWLYGLARLEVLELSHNDISYIEEDVWSYCQLLSRLDLGDNELSLVTERTFAGLGSLQHLLLDNNRMSYIASGAFRDLGSLQVLELDNNEISWTIEDINGAFEGLIGLKRLSLKSNHIKLIAKRAFDGLEHLQELHLENNSLTSIQMNAFGEMKSLQEIYINTSSLVCDCQLAWLPRWLLQTGFQHSVMAKCIHPESLKGLSIMEVDVELFKCNDSPKPVIQVQPESQAALKGSNTSLECVALSSNPSPLVVQWRKDNILIQKGHIENYERTPEEGILELKSILVIENVKDEDSGVYQCVVSNQLGTAYSAKAEITVNVLPYFLKTPEDVTAPAGTTARLECMAMGHPPPRIAWKKDGGDNFPAARERRLLMMPTDDVFFITKVNLEDEGVYSCTAENNVGTIVANATLKVLKKPVFEHEMQDKTVELGSTAVLECMASGSPKPDVQWLKDDKPLQVTKRHFFTAENRLLVIYQTQELDAGIYTCRVSNTLAKEEGHSRLTVDLGQLRVENVQSSTGESQGKGGIFGEDSMMTGIIIIAVVCCVVGTSLIWVIIIYKTRKRTEEYSSTPTDETTIPSTPYHSSDRDSNSPGLLTASHLPSSFGRYPGMEVNAAFGYSPAKGVRLAAVFPSDIEDDDHRQSIPLTSDEQQPAESSDTSIQMLRRARHSTGSDTLHSTPSPHHSAHSLHGSRGTILHTFQPHLATSVGSHSQHPAMMACDICEPHMTVAMVHSTTARDRCDSCPRLDTIISEDETGGRNSSDDRDTTLGHHSDGHHGSQPPGNNTDYSECESCDRHPSVNSNYYSEHNHSSNHDHASSLPQASFNLPHSRQDHLEQPEMGHPISQSAFSSLQSDGTNHSHPSQPNGHIIKPYQLVCSDSCTDLESCLEDEDQQNSVPCVTVIPDWYPSHVSSMDRHVSDTRVS